MFASLLVSVLLVGIKLTAPKEIVQTIERRKELQANLSLLRRTLEEEDKQSWIVDVMHDANERAGRITELGSASGLSYSASEKGLIEKGLDMFALFERSSAGVKQLAHSATILYSETKLDEATGLLLGQAAAMVRAKPQEIVAYLLNQDGRHVQSVSDPDMYVRFEVLQRVNAHHTIIFIRGNFGAGLSARTFLNSLVAKRVADAPPTFVLVAMPIARHDKITPNDEARAVRAENCRAFKLTEVAPGVTKLDYTCSLDLKGSIPQAITNKVAVPGQAHGAPRAPLTPSAHAYFHSLCPWRLAYSRYVPFLRLRFAVSCSPVDATTVLPARPAACPVRRRGRPGRRANALGSRRQQTEGSSACDTRVCEPHGDAPRVRLSIRGRHARSDACGRCTQRF